jgi:hypothetical protein
MSEVNHPAGERKTTLDAADVAELIRAGRARSSAQLKKLLKFHRDRGVPDRDIVAAMAASPHLVNAIGPGRQRP